MLKPCPVPMPRDKLISVAFTILIMAAAAPAGADDDWQTWGAVVATGALTAGPGNLQYWLEGQGRFNDDSSRFGQGILRAALGYRIGERATLWGGYAYIPTDRAAPGDDTVEHRIWQQLTWQTMAPVTGFGISTRTRLEQRRIDGVGGTGWRARQLIKATRPLGDGSRVYLSIWDEVFLNLNSTRWGAADGFDQNRAFVGLGVSLSPQAKIEVGYLNQLIARDEREDLNNHILSITVLLNF